MRVLFSLIPCCASCRKKTFDIKLSRLVPLCTRNTDANRVFLFVLDFVETGVKWKLHTRDEGHIPHSDGWHTFESKVAAQDRACDTIGRQRHVKVLFVEGPDGERIEYPEIEAMCKARAARC
jgi:hypothetical protein